MGKGIGIDWAFSQCQPCAWGCHLGPLTGSLALGVAAVSL